MQAEWMVNNIDPDRTAPSGTVWSWSTLFAQKCSIPESVLWTVQSSSMDNKHLPKLIQVMKQSVYAQPHSLISAFIIHCLDSIIPVFA